MRIWRLRLMRIQLGKEWVLTVMCGWCYAVRDNATDRRELNSFKVFISLMLPSVVIANYTVVRSLYHNTLNFRQQKVLSIYFVILQNSKNITISLVQYITQPQNDRVHVRHSSHISHTQNTTTSHSHHVIEGCSSFYAIRYTNVKVLNRLIYETF